VQTELGSVQCTIILVHWIDKGEIGDFNAREFQCSRKRQFAMEKDQIRKEILTKLAVPVWPVAGQALVLGKHAARTAAARGDIPMPP